MQYEEKILEFIFSDDKDAVVTWIEGLPELEQVDVWREFKVITEKLMAEIGKSEAVEGLCDELEARTNAFEEACLDVQVASLKHELAVKERDKFVEEMEERVHGMRDYLRECVETNAPNAAEMKELAAKIIALEKENGIYDPANWYWFEE
jgi:hypothetical protein